jgi:hypothetical protein
MRCDYVIQRSDPRGTMIRSFERQRFLHLRAELSHPGSDLRLIKYSLGGSKGVPEVLLAFSSRRCGFGFAKRPRLPNRKSGAAGRNKGGGVRTPDIGTSRVA